MAIISTLARVATAVFMLALQLAPDTVAAQPFPAKPIRIVVGFAPGGITDVIGRWLGDAITKETSQPVVIENRTGAAGNIAAATVAKSPADGYTLLLVTSSHVTNRALYASLPYDPIKDFSAISLVAKVPFVLVAHPSFPGKTVADVVGISKERPGSLDYSTSGVGSSNHLTAEQFARIAHFKWNHIAYRGGAPAAMAVAGGEVPLAFLSSSQSLPMVRKGMVKALGISSQERLSTMPDIPTFSELVAPGYEGGTWFGLLAPAGTPTEAIGRLHNIISRSLQSEDMKKKFATQDTVIVNGGPQEFMKVMKEDDSVWFPLIKELGIRSE